MRRVGVDLADVEVKSAAVGWPKNAVETLSAFANGGGGVLILGLSEQHGFTPAAGFDAKAIRDALALACADLVDPPLRVPIEIEEFEGALVVRADIAELDPIEKPCYVKARGHYNGSYIRSGDGDRGLSNYEVSQLLANRTQPTFDMEPVDGATAADLNPDLVSGLLERARSRHPRLFGTMRDEEALLRLNVLTNVEGVVRPTVAGLLCLGVYPQQFFPQLFIAVVALPGLQIGDQTSEGVRFLDNVTIDGPIPEMLAQAVAALQRNMRKAAVIKGLFREDRWDYPLDVVRELLVNAIMHRDYSPGARGSHLQVELYPDRLVVKSTGGLYGDVSAALLGTSEQGSSSRNVALAKLLADVPAGGRGYASISENRGSGLPNVMTALRGAGMSPAAFNATPGHVFVTVPQHALLAVEVIEWIGSLGQDGLSDQQHLALAIMRSIGRVTNAMLQAWGVDRITAGAALRDLVSRELAVVGGGRRYASYQLNVSAEIGDLDADSVPDGAASIEGAGIEAELDAIVQGIRAGLNTAKALETALGMNYQAVLRRLNKLIERGAVEREYARNDRRQSYRLIQRQGDK
ncbi:ATP-binding protein [Antrihabitans spumae]|uniref:ATP-binding protein n=1 Tax=Antrihabitans spumae TaxID=3373370 RepID=A0ABW7KIM1_9NOCA